MKWAIIIIGSLVGLIVLVLIIGAMLPRDHVASMTATIPAPPDKVWAAITDIGAFPTWRSDLQRVEIVSQPQEAKRWREYSRHGAVTMAIESAEAPRRLLVQIADKDLPFGGGWAYDIAPDKADGSTSRVTITERGYVSNPIFRFVSRFVMGHYSSLDAYLRALGRKFGSDVTPVRA